MDKLIKTSEFYDTIDLVITPVICANRSWEHRYFNKAFSMQIGYTTEEIPDVEGWFNKAYPDEAYRNEVKKGWKECSEKAERNSDPHKHLMARVYCADGTYKWFDVHDNTFGDISVITFLDVNDVRKSNDALVEALQQKNTLMSIIAHDVRGPLSNIRQIINSYDEMNFSEQEIKSILTKLDVQAEHVLNMIGSILLRTSREMDIFKEQYEQIALKKFLSKYRKIYNERLKQQEVALIFELQDDPVINYDPFILDVISRNIIDNAIKYTPKNGSIFISFEKKERSSDLVIRDTGPGMSAKQIDSILTNRGGSQIINRALDGFGVGLIMAKEILEKQGGKLLIESEPQKGTTFTISLPYDSHA
ncbi:MAG: PAS domain-containing sensor histidine kinase [Bacteroidota bacterium]